MNEHENEPIRGLPAMLPAGEQLLWQGEPDWKHLALRVFHIRKVIAYFALLIVAILTYSMSQGASFISALFSAIPQLLMCSIAIGLLTLLAWLYGKTTVYSITNKRLVMRFGVAIQMIINIPWSKIESADFRKFKDGSGDLVFSINSETPVSYWAVWPHARPWRWFKAEPMMRSVEDAEAVGEILSNVLTSNDQQFGYDAESPTQPSAGGFGMNPSAA